jgi:hypothetical protein
MTGDAAASSVATEAVISVPVVCTMAFSRVERVLLALDGRHVGATAGAVRSRIRNGYDGHGRGQRDAT